jgi:uncharacterized Zn finger protein
MNNETVNISVGLENTDAVTCDECGSEVFSPSFLLRKVSALLSPSGKDALVPIQVFSCDKCGHVNEEFLPIEKA